METIALSLSSPKIALPGLDDAIAKLERIDALQQKLTQNGTIRIRMFVAGADKIDEAAANVEQLHATLKALGQESISSGLKQGVLTVGDVAQFAAGKVEKLNREFAQASTQAVQMQARWETLDDQLKRGRLDFVKGDKLTQARKELDATIDKAKELAGQMRGFERLYGMAGAMTGVRDTTPIARVGEEEKKATPHIEKAATALKGQEQIVLDKIQAMGKLAEVTEKVTKREKELKQHVDAAAKAEVNRTGLISRRITVEDGEEKGRVEKYRTGEGQTLTIAGGAEISELNRVQQFGNEFEAIRSDFAARRSALAQGGFEKGSAEQIKLLHEEVAAHRQMLTLMSQQGLEAERLAKLEATRANRLEEMARLQQLALVNRQKQGKLQEYQAQFELLTNQFAGTRASAAEQGYGRGSREQIDLLKQEAAERTKIVEQMEAAGMGGERLARMEAIKVHHMQQQAAQQDILLKRKQAEQMQSGISQRLDERFKTSAADLERQHIQERALIQTKEDSVRVLRKQAAEYQQLHAVMAAAGRGSDPLGLSVQKRATKLATEAGTTERELLAARQRIQQMSAQFQKDFQAFGGKQKKVSEVSGPDGRTQRQRAMRDDANGMREMIELTRRWDAAGNELVPTLTRASTALEQKSRSATAAGRSMLHNLATVTAWAASVGVLYQSLNLLRYGFDSLLKVEGQSRRLEAVFRGSNAEGRAMAVTMMDLRDQALALATANGRSADEAMDAAIRWARLGLTQREVAEAVDVSLKAANVAEIETSEAAEQLAAVFAAYGMHVGQLRTVLGELNTVSNVYNVTNKELLAGIARSSAIAKQAGIGFSELVGIIGAGVGRTGRTGAEMGNAIKAVIVSLSNPALQKFLRGEFGLDVKTPAGELKDFSTLLNEIFVAYQKLSKLQQGEFLQKVGGKQQASRLQAMIDGYVTSQVLAIKAQQNLGSAERENALIRSSTVSQVQSLSTAFQRLVVNLANVGSSFKQMDGSGRVWLDPSISGQITAIIELLSHMVRIAGNLPGLLLGLGVGFVIMATRVARAALTMTDGTRKGNILTRTLTHMRDIWGTVQDAIRKANGELVTNTALLQANAKAASNNAAAAANMAAGKLGPSGLPMAPKGLRPPPVPAAVGGAASAAGTAVVGGLARGVTKAATGSLWKSALKLLFGSLFGSGMLAFIGSMIAVELGIALVNKVMRAFSSEGERAADSLGVYNKELERTKGLLGAADLSARLASTLSKALPDLNQRSPRAARQAIEEFSKIAYSPADDPTGERQRLLKDELTMLLRSGKEKELQARLQQVEAGFLRQKSIYATQEMRTRRQAMESQAKTMEMLEREIKSRRARGQDVMIQEQKLEEAKRAYQGLQGEALQNFANAYDPDVPNVSEFQKELGERFKEQFKGIDAVLSAMPTVTKDDEEEKIQRKLDVLRQQIQLLDDTKTAAKSASDAAIAGAKQEYDATTKQWSGLKSLREQRQRLADDLARAQKRERDEKEFQAGLLPFMRDPKRTAVRKAEVGRRDAAVRLDEFDKEHGPILQKERELARLMEERLAKVWALKDGQKGQLDAVDAEIRKKKEEIAEEQKKLEIAREYARIQDAIGAGKRDAKNRSTAFQIGQNDTEQGLNETRAIIGRNGIGLLDRARAERENAIASNDPVGRARAESEILQLGARLTELQLSLEERRYKLARDIVNERQKEAIEASKNLMLASREDQLRAALLKRFTDRNGGFSANQFAFLDEGTRNAAQKFAPGALPPELESRARSLEREQVLLERNLQGLTTAIGETVRGIRGINLNTNPNSAQGGATPAVPQIQAPNINIEFAPQFQQMIQSVTAMAQTAINGQLAEMRNEFRNFMATFRPGVAQAGGAESVNSAS